LQGARSVLGQLYGIEDILAYGGGSIFKNGIHEQVINNLKGHEIVEFQVLNPHFETLMKAVAIVKEQNRLHTCSRWWISN
jgi:NADP-dependent alcohol dehydrogenase